MTQVDEAIDVRGILSVKASNQWDADIGYGDLVVNNSDTHGGVIDLAPLNRGSNAQQILAAGAIALWNDGLATAHDTFQADKSSSGSLWHAILHRREGDFSNSKYWLARAGRHPINQTLGKLVEIAVTPHAGDPLFLPVFQGGWNASAFVDLVRQAASCDDSAFRSTVVALQRLEWRALFCHCSRFDH